MLLDLREVNGDICKSCSYMMKRDQIPMVSGMSGHWRIGMNKHTKPFQEF